jgi:hypothetical protein
MVCSVMALLAAAGCSGSGTAPDWEPSAPEDVVATASQAQATEAALDPAGEASGSGPGTGVTRAEIVDPKLPRPPLRIAAPCSTVGLLATPQQLALLAGVPRHRRHPVERAVAMLFVVPMHEAVDPRLRLLQGLEGLFRIADAGLHGAEERLGA